MQWAEAHFNELELKNIRAFKFKNDRDLTIAGKIISLIGFRQLGYEIHDLKALAYSEFTRPHLHQFYDCDFNISHSADVAVVAIVKAKVLRVGVDIENVS
jgi:phosphopantetheinyl transferase